MSMLQKPFILLAVLLIFCLTGCRNNKSIYPQNRDALKSKIALYEGFQNPPNKAKPTVYFILLNGYLNKDFVQEELEQYAEKGIGGLLVFDIGIIGREEFFPPAGPKFMSDEWLDNFSFIVEKADELGMSVELAACSSWDMGGSWVEPDEAVLALYQNSITVPGPRKLQTKLKYPELPESAILDKNGKPVISEEVAVLAIPVKKRQEAYSFVYKLGYDKLHELDHIVLSNCENINKDIAGGKNIFTQNFSVDISETDDKDASFKVVYNGKLQANTKQQKFILPKDTKAKFVRLKIYDGYNKKSHYVQLAEFEVYNNEGEDVIHRPYNNRSDGGMEVRFNSQLGSERNWRAKNLNDGKYEGDAGSWISNGKTPVLIEDVNSIQIISDHLSADGVLEWDVPAGEWEIIRYVMSNTGEKLKIPNPASDGLATDHLSAAATKNFINYMTERLESKFGDLSNSPIDNLYLPSYEVKGLLWTYDLPQQFKSYRSYDLIKYLPALNGYIIEDEETTARFLYDYQKTMGDLLVDGFYITANNTAKERGMAIKAESAGPGAPIHLVPVEALRALNSVNEMQGEFWPWREHWDGLWVVKETASAAHIYGGKTVHMESFTGFRHWMDGPVDLKPSADRAFCEGMNHVVWHMAAHNPPEAGKPGWVYHAGSHFNVNLVWWNQMKPWLDYLARSSFLLQQGLFVGDVVYYYGDKGANFILPKHTNRSLDFGYDYDVTNLEVMLTRMDVKDYKIVLPDGMSYEVLVLPDQDDITLAALQRIEELAAKGATILGPEPIKSTGLYQHRENDAAIQKLAGKLWGNINGTTVKENNYGKGKFIFEKTINEVLAERGVNPDFQFNSSDENAELDYIHRRTEHEEIYFIRNKGDHPVTFVATFRVNNKTPELWFADNGDKRPQLVFEEREDGISFEMNLDSYGSVFVVFSPDENRDHLESITGENIVNSIDEEMIALTAFKNGDFEMLTKGNRNLKFSVKNIPEPIEITGEWKISFAEGWGAPDSVVTTELNSLSEFDNQGINYYSGITHYENSFTISEKEIGIKNKIFLDLGKLWLLADVTVNGKYIGTLWKAPYRIEITDVVKAGENRLAIDIANTWCNRLIGDAIHPDKIQYCQTNIGGHETLEARSWANIPLRESGLFGPVKVVFAKEKSIMH
jgi:hypothetical protein